MKTIMKMRNFKITIKMAAFNLHFNLVEPAGSVGASGVTDYALRITPPAALAAGNEQSGKMARKIKRTDGMINTFKAEIEIK